MATLETIQNERRDAARRVLESYSTNCVINKQLLKLLENADSRLLSATAQMEETRGSGTAKDAIGAHIAAIHQEAERLTYASERIAVKLDEVLRIVERVSERSHLAGKILSMRYLEPGRLMELEEIASALNYDDEYIRKRHLVALDMAADVIYENKSHNVT